MSKTNDITNASKIVENERTAVAQKLTTQPDGPGLRIGKRGEISGIFPLVPDGARKFRERLPQFQAEAAYWEERVGTVHEFHMFLLDNDTKVFFTIVFDGDFKPYLEDIANRAGSWLDSLFLGTVDGYKGINDPGFPKWLGQFIISAEFFFASYPEATCRDVKKALRVQGLFERLLDEAQQS
jgi:hypothetical protein